MFLYANQNVASDCTLLMFLAAVAPTKILSSFSHLTSTKGVYTMSVTYKETVSFADEGKNTGNGEDGYLPIDYAGADSLLAVTIIVTCGRLNKQGR